MVSILIPFYGVEKYFERCLNSVFRQTYQNVEYVFVDDCSTDLSMELLKKAILKYRISSDQYTIISHNQNEGVAKSRIECINYAKGDYVYFVDADDWIESNAIEQMVGATKGGFVDIVGCDFMKDYLDEISYYYHENYTNTCKGNMIKCLNYEIATVLWKLLIKRRLFDYFTISPINIGEDYVISVKLFYYANSFVSLDKAFYHYVQYNSNRLSFQSLRSITDHINCVKEVESFCIEKGIYDDIVAFKLNLRKFNIKSNFLTKHLLDYRAFKTTFPESNGMWRYLGYSHKEKIKFWLAEHNLYCLIRFIKKYERFN